MPVNPSDRVDLTWSKDFQSILDALNKRLREPFRSNVNLVTRALLTHLQLGDKNLTVRDIVDSVYDNDRPKGGWIGFDHDKWYAYVPSVVAQLKNELPRLLAEVKAGKVPYFSVPPRS